MIWNDECKAALKSRSTNDNAGKQFFTCKTSGKKISISREYDISVSQRIVDTTRKLEPVGKITLYVISQCWLTPCILKAFTNYISGIRYFQKLWNFLVRSLNSSGLINCMVFQWICSKWLSGFWNNKFAPDMSQKIKWAGPKFPRHVGMS